MYTVLTENFILYAGLPFYLEFDNLGKKKPGIVNNFNILVVKFQFHTKTYHENNIILCHQKIVLFKNTLKVTLQNIFNVFMLFNTVSLTKPNFKLKISQKMCTLKCMEEVLKTRKNFDKLSGNPVYGSYDLNVLSCYFLL